VGDNVYATPFHPELDAGICTRIDVYKNNGYFAPESAETLK
jgi:GMP synthase (glutamine-hydrolysing)